MQMLCNIFSNPVITTNERIIIWAVFGFEEEECVFYYYFVFFTVYGHDSQWSVTNWTNSQSCFNNYILPLPPMLNALCLFTRPVKRQTQQDLLSLLVNNRVFFLCWCTTGSSFPAGTFPTSKFCHGNQTKWPLVIKHIKWVENDQMIITAKYVSHHCTCYGENAIQPFSHCKSKGPFSCDSNPTKRQITITLANS